jgi:hypothetical protein
MNLLTRITCSIVAIALPVFGQSYQPQGGYTPQPTYQPPTQSSYQAPQSSYQQYPSDPYSGKPQPTQTSSYQGNYTGSVGYESLLSYGYLDARYNFNSFKNLSSIDGGSGFGATLSVPIFKPFYMRLGVNWLHGSNSSGSKDFSMTSFSGGLGARIPITSRFHLFGEIGARYDSVSGKLWTISTDDFAVYLRPGIRVAATQKLELDAALTLNSTDNLNAAVISLEGYYNMISFLDLGAGVDISDDVNSYHIGLRMRW